MKPYKYAFFRANEQGVVVLAEPIASGWVLASSDQNARDKAILAEADNLNDEGSWKIWLATYNVS